METKQVIVVRKDLNMRKGKLAAQVAHASMAAILKCFSEVRNVGEKRSYFGAGFSFYEPIYLWLTGSFTKIVVSVNSIEELLELEAKCKEAELLHALITDNGKTEFKIPTITCLAVGPDFSERVDKITGGLNLL